MTGPDLDATIESPELGGAERIEVKEIRPFVEGKEGALSTVFSSIGVREDLDDPVVFGPLVPLDVYKKCDHRTNSRYARFRVVITGGFKNFSTAGLDAIGTGKR